MCVYYIDIIYKTAGITINNLMCYNIFDSSNNTLVYDGSASSTTLANSTDDVVYNIDVSARNFKYYDLSSNIYTKYNNFIYI